MISLLSQRICLGSQIPVAITWEISSAGSEKLSFVVYCRCVQYPPSLSKPKQPYICAVEYEVLSCCHVPSQVTAQGVLAVGRNLRVRALLVAYLPRVKAVAIQELVLRPGLDLRAFGMRMHW
jgi:hypothetical protein